MLDKLVNYVLMFFIYSAIGWAVESTYRTVGEYFTSGKKEFKIINTGFLNGPICPIYGTGALVFEILVVPFSEPHEKRWWLVILVGALFADVVEYITSFLMEKLFHARWWDYTDEFLNIKGRICFKHTCYWGLFAFLFCYLISPVYAYMMSFIPTALYKPILIVILVIFVLDLTVTVRAAADVSKLIRKLDELKLNINTAAEMVKATAETLLGDAQEKYSGIQQSIASGSERLSAWKNDVSEQLSELKKQAEAMSKRGEGKYPRRTKRLFRTYAGKRSFKTLAELEKKWNEVKGKFKGHDSDS